MAHVGIDFGTTNTTCVEIAGPTRSIAKYGDEAGRPLPSILVIDKNTGHVQCGREVWEHREKYLSQPHRYHVISSVKAELESPDPIPVLSGEWTKPRLVAQILRHLSERRRRTYGGDNGISKATFSVPVGMSPFARRMLRQAAEIANIEVTSFVKESTAALVREWDSLRSCAYVVVFDWGGGTLDVSVLDIRGDGISELWTKGLPSAGIHIDRELAKLVHRRIMHERGQAKPFVAVADNDRDRLICQSEQRKCDLSDSLGDGLIAIDYDGAESLVELTLEDLDAVSAPFVDDAVTTLSDAIVSAGISSERVDQILVIGGSSRLPLLRRRLEADRRFRARLHWPSEPDWAVAHGAAVLEGRPGCFALAETISLELSDSDQFPLATPGDTTPGPPSTLNLAIIDQKAPGAGGHDARIILNRIRPGELKYSPLRRFTVPVQGYVEEEVHLRYELTGDQTFLIQGVAPKTGRSPVVQETEELRFVYRLEGSH